MGRMLAWLFQAPYPELQGLRTGALVFFGLTDVISTIYALLYGLHETNCAFQIFNSVYQPLAGILFGLLFLFLKAVFVKAVEWALLRVFKYREDRMRVLAAVYGFLMAEGLIFTSSNLSSVVGHQSLVNAKLIPNQGC